MLFKLGISIHPSIHPSVHPSCVQLAGGLTPWPYLLQHIHGVPAALQSGGEAGCCRGIVILCCLREKLGHRYLIRHPLAGKMPTGGLAMNAQKHKTMKDLKNREKAGGVWRDRELDGRESRFSSQKLCKTIEMIKTCLLLR